MSNPVQREEAVFNAALDLPAQFRADYLKEVCGEEPQLLVQVKALFDALGQPIVGFDETAAMHGRRNDEYQSTAAGRHPRRD